MWFKERGGLRLASFALSAVVGLPGGKALLPGFLLGFVPVSDLEVIAIRVNEIDGAAGM